MSFLCFFLTFITIVWYTIYSIWWKSMLHDDWHPSGGSWQWGASSKVKPLLISGSICRAWILYSGWPARDGTFYTQNPWWTIPPWIMLCNITPDHETCKGGSIVGSECLLFWRLNLHLLKVPILFSSCHSSVRLIQFWLVMSLLVLAITSLHMYIIIRSWQEYCWSGNWGGHSRMLRNDWWVADSQGSSIPDLASAPPYQYWSLFGNSR